MTSESEEEIFNRYATNDRKTRLKKKRTHTSKRKKSSKSEQENVSKRNISMAPVSVYVFNFFLFSSLGSLMPFLPVFFRLLGFSSLQNGLLFATRPLISFWWGPLSSSFATSSRFRKLFLFTFVAGAIASTFCFSIVRANEGWILIDASCNPDISSSHRTTHNIRNYSLYNGIGKEWHNYPANSSFHSDSKISADNETTPYTWKTYIKTTSTHIYHQLKKGILMKTLFMYVLVLTIVSELCLSPTLHITQASIKFTSRQPFFNSQCLNRVFCKVGMAVASFSIACVAWKYQCTFRNVHHFYFHFYGFLATGCITALIALALPTIRPQKTSFIGLVCNNLLSLVFNCDNFGYIFGLWIAGISEGTINAYLLWYASVNGASELTIGLLVSLAIITDMILHFTVGISMKWIGHMGLLSVGIFLISIQFFILANVTNPYYMIPSQLMFGLASCCIRSSFIGSINSNGTKEMEKVLFFIFQAAYMGLGLGLGGVFVSIPYFLFGAQPTFSALGVLTISYSILVAIVQLIIYKKRGKAGRLNKQMYTKLSSHEPNGDWLVDALLEEEKQKKELGEEDSGFEKADAPGSQHDRAGGNNNDEDVEISVQAVS